MKADDLIDTLIATAKAEVDSRHPELTDDERRDIATQIAIGALRYFMLKFTTQFGDRVRLQGGAGFEGETGPYVQYAVVRASNIFRKGGTTPEEVLGRCQRSSSSISAKKRGNEIWELWLLAAKTSHIVDQSIAQAEPAYLAKHAFQLAQQFNNFYHRHHILTEPDEGRKHFLLATAAVVRRELIRVLAAMGMEAPSVM